MSNDMIDKEKKEDPEKVVNSDQKKIDFSIMDKMFPIEFGSKQQEKDPIIRYNNSGITPLDDLFLNPSQYLTNSGGLTGNIMREIIIESLTKETIVVINSLKDKGESESLKKDLLEKFALLTGKQERHILNKYANMIAAKEPESKPIKETKDKNKKLIELLVKEKFIDADVKDDWSALLSGNLTIIVNYNGSDWKLYQLIEILIDAKYLNISKDEIYTLLEKRFTFKKKSRKANVIKNNYDRAERGKSTKFTTKQSEINKFYYKIIELIK